jgi:type VI secretion system protein ImpK
MSERIYGICAEVLMLAARLPQSPSLPPASDLRQRLQMALDALVGKGRAAGVADADIAEVRYALVAFIDEQVQKSNWPGRAEWTGRPLQLVLYDHVTAGEIFFTRMRNLLNEGNRLDALMAYTLCLMLGFRGHFGSAGDDSGLTSFIEAARQQLGRALPRSDRIGPHAEPNERARRRRTSNAPLIAFILGGLLLAVGGVLGLRYAVESETREALEALPPTAMPVAPK